MNRYRHEYKYFINSFDKVELLARLEGILEKDCHVLEDGGYRIRSVYFDDLNDTCLYQNIDGTDPRSKYRIRYYNRDIDRIQLEKKSKYRGMTYKESCPLSTDECHILLCGDYLDESEYEGLKAQLLLDLRLGNLVPKVIVTYDRIPFVFPGGNVRITFDSNLTSSNDIRSFLVAEYGQRSVFSDGCSILEVKWDELLPLHIRETLQISNMSWTAFSKYYYCRVYHL